MAPSATHPVNIKTEEKGRIPLGAYIFHRLHELGISHVFGCPGDFNLNFLDHIYTVPSMNWVGTCNELNGAYAADGYARVRGIPGALVTTYGVGELSAINGISGAYSEHVPIIHVVGTTSRLARKDRIMIHHTLGENWDHDTFQRISEPVRSASAFLIDDATFTKDVDSVIETCVKTRRPVYIYIPMDTPDILVDSSPLFTPLSLEITNDEREDEEDAIVDEIIEMLEKAQQPTVLVDVLAHRYGSTKDVKTLLERSGLPAFVTPLSKSTVDETGPPFIGLYNGQLTPHTAVKSRIESSDAILHIGPFPSDSNTGGWTHALPASSIIHLGHDRISFAGKTFASLHFVPILKKLVTRISSPLTSTLPKNTTITPELFTPPPSTPLDQHHFYRQFSPQLSPGDIIIAEVGSAQYGTLELALPAHTTFFTQLYYSCIGFTVGALLGACIARREQSALPPSSSPASRGSGRVWLFIGDGSLQMTVQELSTVLRHGFTPTIVLINNSGYTIERVIHGPTQPYNDIAPWNYQSLLSLFSPNPSKSYSVRTYGELHSVLDDEEFKRNEVPMLLEVHMDPMDSPWMLTKQINVVQEKTGRALRKWDRECGRERRGLESNLWQSKHALVESAAHKFVVGHKV